MSSKFPSSFFPLSFVQSQSSHHLGFVWLVTWFFFSDSMPWYYFITIFGCPFGKICFLVVLTTLSKSNCILFFCQNLDRPLSFPCDAAFSAGPLRFACGTMTWMSLGTWTKCNQFLMYIKFVGTLHHVVVGYDEGARVLQHLRNA